MAAAGPRQAPAVLFYQPNRVSYLGHIALRYTTRPPTFILTGYATPGRALTCSSSQAANSANRNEFVSNRRMKKS